MPATPTKNTTVHIRRLIACGENCGNTRGSASPKFSRDTQESARVARVHQHRCHQTASRRVRTFCLDDSFLLCSTTVVNQTNDAKMIAELTDVCPSNSRQSVDCEANVNNRMSHDQSATIRCECCKVISTSQGIITDSVRKSYPLRVIDHMRRRCLRQRFRRRRTVVQP